MRRSPIVELSGSTGPVGWIDSLGFAKSIGSVDLIESADRVGSVRSIDLHHDWFELALGDRSLWFERFGSSAYSQYFVSSTEGVCLFVLSRGP